MKLFIRKIVLWPKDPRHSFREIALHEHGINLVTGRSRTGKSALTYIVDYVLGSGKCAIPVGVIRSSVSWYGLLLDVGGAQLLVAREEPEERVESSNYCVLEDVLVVPDQPVKTTNRESFKRRMNELAGLPTLDLEPSTERVQLGRPSFRDMASFNFLPQHIVANPYTLFYKADSEDNRKKLRIIFPFVLGVLNAVDLAAEHEFAEIDAKLRRLRAQLDRRARAAEAWKADVFGFHARALDLGLLAPDTPRPNSMAACIRQLDFVVASATTVDRALPTRQTGAAFAAAERLEVIRQEEREAGRSLAAAQGRLEQIRGVKGGAQDFAAAAALHVERVQGVGWFQSRVAQSAPCPICGSEHGAAADVLKSLSSAAADLNARHQAAVAAPVTLEREEKDLRQTVAQHEDALRDLRIERSELEAARKRDGGQGLEEVFRFVGRVEEALRNVRLVDEDGDLRTEIDALSARLAALAVRLDPARRKARLDAALQVLSRRIGEYATFMDLEHSGDAISFRANDLSLVFTALGSGRADYLWEIGSGANWMGYHIATLLALHEYFLSVPLSPVPRFLMIDQPSQVYFPTGWPSDGNPADAAHSHDVEATRQIFEALEEGIRRTDSQVQIIVTEHVDERTLAGISSIRVVADWHSDDVDWLIPRAWLSG